MGECSRSSNPCSALVSVHLAPARDVIFSVSIELTRFNLLQICLAAALLDDPPSTDWPVFWGAAVFNRASNMFPLLCFSVTVTVSAVHKNPLCVCVCVFPDRKHALIQQRLS